MSGEKRSKLLEYNLYKIGAYMLEVFFVLLFFKPRTIIKALNLINDYTFINK